MTIRAPNSRGSSEARLNLNPSRKGRSSCRTSILPVNKNSLEKSRLLVNAGRNQREVTVNLTRAGNPTVGILRLKVENSRSPRKWRYSRRKDELSVVRWTGLRWDQNTMLMIFTWVYMNEIVNLSFVEFYFYLVWRLLEQDSYCWTRTAMIKNLIFLITINVIDKYSKMNFH